MATLKVEKREGKGKYQAFAIRKAGGIPGVVYGRSLKENLNVSVNRKDFLTIVKTGERIIDLDVSGAPIRVLIKAVQHGTYDHDILHADFRVISADEVIEITLEIRLQGDAPGIAVGGMLEQNLHRISARCLPKDLPEKVILDVGAVKIGDILYARDLPQLPGVEYLYHGNPAVVSCHHPRGEEPSAPAADSEEPAAPEVIGEKEREAKAKDKE
ncbi:MAG: 50S ribosomal protein L25 [Planctomycetes bacterium]|nr:50S ribosomal protein L25 [Planctomycetota bacterium]